MLGELCDKCTEVDSQTVNLSQTCYLSRETLQLQAYVSLATW